MVMLHYLVYNFGLLLFIIGLFFIVSSVVGIIRLKDTYTKAHAAGIADSCGIPMTLVGLYITNYQTVSIMKITILIVLIFLLSPTATYMLLKTSSNYNNNSQSTKENTHITHDTNS